MGVETKTDSKQFIKDIIDDAPLEGMTAAEKLAAEQAQKDLEKDGNFGVW